MMMGLGFSLIAVFAVSGFSYELLRSDTTYEATGTQLKAVKRRLTEKSSSVSNGPTVNDDGTISCGDLLGLGSLEKGSDAGSGVDGVIDKAAVQRLGGVGMVEEYLDREAYIPAGGEGKTSFDVAVELADNQRTALSTVALQDLQHRLRIEANVYEQLRLCEKLYLETIRGNMELQKKYAKRMQSGWLRFNGKAGDKNK